MGNDGPNAYAGRKFPPTRRTAPAGLTAGRPATPQDVVARSLRPMKKRVEHGGLQDLLFDLLVFLRRQAMRRHDLAGGCNTAAAMTLPAAATSSGVKKLPKTLPLASVN